MEQHIPMTEELVEKLTPSKEMEERDVEERNKILEGVGEVCMAQRQYHLATKKFTQCGSRVKVCWRLLQFTLLSNQSLWPAWALAGFRCGSAQW